MEIFENSWLFKENVFKELPLKFLQNWEVLRKFETIIESKNVAPWIRVSEPMGPNGAPP